jgi:hypothetical protein
MPDGSRLLTIDELARVMRRPPAQIQVLIGKGCPVRYVHGEALFDPQEVVKWTQASGQTAAQLCDE